MSLDPLPEPCTPRSPSVMGLLSSWSEPMPVRGLLLCSASARGKKNTGVSHLTPVQAGETCRLTPPPRSIPHRSAAGGKLRHGPASSSRPAGGPRLSRHGGRATERPSLQPATGTGTAPRWHAGYGHCSRRDGNTPGARPAPRHGDGRLVPLLPSCLLSSLQPLPSPIPAPPGSVTVAWHRPHHPVPPRPASPEPPREGSRAAPALTPPPHQSPRRPRSILAKNNLVQTLSSAVPAHPGTAWHSQRTRCLPAPHRAREHPSSPPQTPARAAPEALPKLSPYSPLPPPRPHPPPSSLSSILLLLPPLGLWRFSFAALADAGKGLRQSKQHRQNTAAAAASPPAAHRAFFPFFPFFLPLFLPPPLLPPLCPSLHAAPQSLAHTWLPGRLFLAGQAEAMWAAGPCAAPPPQPRHPPCAARATPGAA